MKQISSYPKNNVVSSDKRQSKNNDKGNNGGMFKEYYKALTIILLPMVFVFTIIRFYSVDKNIAFKTAILSMGIENPKVALEMLKNRFSDKLLDEKVALDSSHSENPPKQKDHNEEVKNENIVTAQESTLNNQKTDVRANDSQEHKDSAAEVEETVPDEFKGPIIEETFKGGSFPLYINTGYGFIRNQTKVGSDNLLDKLKSANDVTLNIDDKPQVLLFSTHATESFETRARNFYDNRYNSRSTDNDKNVTSIEDKIATKLRNNGINVIVDKTQHDYPSYNGSYNRSAVTINNYLKQYPNIKIILDIHRDAIERENGERVKPVAMIDGKKAAQIMIISGCDDGTMNFPNWVQNLKFAVALQNKMESKYPSLTRPIFLCYRRYNMHITPGSLLIEFGTNSNSLEEVQYSGELMGQALSELLLSINQSKNS